MAKAVKKNPYRVRVRHSTEFKLEAVRQLKLGQKRGTELVLELAFKFAIASVVSAGKTSRNQRAD